MSNSGPDVTWRGSSLLTRAAATGKARSPVKLQRKRKEKNEGSCNEKKLENYQVKFSTSTENLAGPVTLTAGQWQRKLVNGALTLPCVPVSLGT